MEGNNHSSAKMSDSVMNFLESNKAHKLRLACLTVQHIQLLALRHEEWGEGGRGNERQRPGEKQRERERRDCL